MKKSDTDPQSLRAADRNLVDDFTDYLNFFEWIGFLCSSNQLTNEDVDVMFAYYLKRLLQVDKNQFLRKYIQEKDYQQLHRLLNRYSAVTT